jgi:hypothetical protein
MAFHDAQRQPLDSSPFQAGGGIQRGGLFQGRSRQVRGGMKRDWQRQIELELSERVVVEVAAQYPVCVAQTGWEVGAG